MMEGFGVHTVRWVNAEGKAHFVKFHWKPVLGTHSLVWDEAQTISGKDPDFHRRDLWDAIEGGDFPEWELGLQLFGADTAALLPFDAVDKSADETTVYYFAGIDGARFKRPVEPGDQLVLEVAVLRAKAGIYKFSGRATVDGQLAAEAELMCTMRTIA